MTLYATVINPTNNIFIKTSEAITHILLGNHPCQYGIQIRRFGHCVRIHHQNLMSVTRYILFHNQTADRTISPYCIIWTVAVMNVFVINKYFETSIRPYLNQISPHLLQHVGNDILFTEMY
jgi:hypothetical protein